MYEYVYIHRSAAVQLLLNGYLSRLINEPTNGSWAHFHKSHTIASESHAHKLINFIFNEFRCFFFYFFIFRFREFRVERSKLNFERRSIKRWPNNGKRSLLLLHANCPMTIANAHKHDHTRRDTRTHNVSFELTRVRYLYRQCRQCWRIHLKRTVSSLEASKFRCPYKAVAYVHMHTV